MMILLPRPNIPWYHKGWKAVLELYSDGQPRAWINIETGEERPWVDGECDPFFSLRSRGVVVPADKLHREWVLWPPEMRVAEGL